MIKYPRGRQEKRTRLPCFIVPHSTAKKIVMRLLTKRSPPGNDQAGFEPESLKKFEPPDLKPYGMVLVTPTGSGKTNTLYSSVSRLNTVDTNI